MLFVLLAAVPAARAADTPPSGLVFVEARAEPVRCHVGQAFRVVLRVGFDTEQFRTHPVPLFRQPMDVPLQVQAPWLRRLEGASPLPPDEPRTPAEGLSLVLDGRVRSLRRLADVTRHGRRFTVLEASRRYRADGAGTLDLEGTSVRFAYATRFDHDIFGDPVPLDPRPVVVKGAPAHVVVQPLPAAGRPPDFDGAIGSFRASVQVDRREVAVGQSFHLTLLVVGEGNLASLRAPRLDLDGFHVLGALARPAPGRLEVTYELEATRVVAAVPPIAFAWFDPQPPGAYHVLHLPAVPLEVRPAGAPAHARNGRRGTWVQVLLAAAALLLVLLGIGRLVRPAPEPSAPPETPVEDTRLAAACTAVRVHAAEPGADRLALLAEVVAARLDAPRAAAISPHLAPRLVQAGVEREAARQAAGLLETLLALRYGALVADPGPEPVLQVAEALARRPR
jgi:hypothetical protein